MVGGGRSQTGVPSVWAFTLSSGTNKKIPVKFSCRTLSRAAAPRCRMWRRCDETCSRRRRVRVCEDVCVRDGGGSEVRARRGGSHGAPEPSRAGLFDLWPLRLGEFNGTTLARELWHKREEGGFDLKTEQKKRTVQSWEQEVKKSSSLFTSPLHPCVRTNWTSRTNHSYSHHTVERSTSSGHTAAGSLKYWTRVGPLCADSAVYMQNVGIFQSTTNRLGPLQWSRNLTPFLFWPLFVSGLRFAGSARSVLRSPAFHQVSEFTSDLQLRTRTRSDMWCDICIYIYSFMLSYASKILRKQKKISNCSCVSPVCLCLTCLRSVGGSMSQLFWQQDVWLEGGCLATRWLLSPISGPPPAAGLYDGQEGEVMWSL